MADSSSDGHDDARIAVLPASLADQIAAGEVVERPGSIVKELVENAIDAGATRVEVEIEGGGRERIRVIDDGRGIHRDDLLLAVTRHATSKLSSAAQLVEIHTLGFRGEALASIAAVATVEIRSRVTDQPVGHRLRSDPGSQREGPGSGRLGAVETGSQREGPGSGRLGAVETGSQREGPGSGRLGAVKTSSQPSLEPIGMPFGTQVEIAGLFASVPARRKFLRSEATEVGHCVDAVTRAALVHPGVQFRVRHGARELLELPATDQTSRVIALLQRRGGAGPFCHFARERDGVRVEGWFGSPSAATRQRSASFVVVRRRVVRERTLAAVLKQAYGDALPRGSHPCACLFVEPPRGTVDVNVHPQKSEVRFSSAQTLYAVVRELVNEGLADAPWRRPPEHGDRDEPGPDQEDPSHHGWARPSAGQDGARAALAGWSRHESLSTGVTARDGDGSSGGGGGGYRLGTRAAGGDYRSDKLSFRGEVEQLRSSLAQVHRETERAWSGPSLPFDDEPARAQDQASSPEQPQAQPREDTRDGPRLLTCLPGPVALFEFGGELLVADLRRVRAHLVRRRLLAELAATGPEGRAPAQGLLTPVVVRRSPEDRACLLAAGDGLARLGLELDGFGEDSVLVRAVPAVLPKLLDGAEVGALLDRLMPWLKLHEQAAESGSRREGFADAVAEAASAQTIDTSGRLARRWLAELLAEHSGSIDELPGLRRWSAAALLD